MIRVIRIFLLVLILSVLSFNVIHALDKSQTDNVIQPLEIINITPTGEDVPAGRQITFQFNRSVVPLGRMDRDSKEIPIVITPEVKGQWRWFNNTTLALMLGESSALNLATHYNITVNPGIKTEDGANLKDTIRHTFITERPRVIKTLFKTWESPHMPVMRIIFNQPISKDSVGKHLAIRIKGNDKKLIAFNIKPDSEYEKSLKYMFRLSEEYVQRTFPEILSQYKRKEKITLVKNGIDYRVAWVVSPKDEIPEGSSIEYYIKPGLASAYGPESGTENRMIDSVPAFPSFSFIGIECYNNEHGKVLITQNDGQYCCNPEKTMHLVFSSPVFKKEVMENISIEPDINFDQDDHPEQFYFRSSTLSKKLFEKYSIFLPGNFKPNKNYKIKSNSNNIIDVFGRVIDKPFEVRFTTDHLLPNYNRYNPVVVLEKNADTEMPFYTTNLDSITFTYDRLTARDKDSSLNTDFHSRYNRRNTTPIKRSR